jgi:hypothetical protein
MVGATAEVGHVSTPMVTPIVAMSLPKLRPRMVMRAPGAAAAGVTDVTTGGTVIAKGWVELAD